MSVSLLIVFFLLFAFFAFLIIRQVIEGQRNKTMAKITGSQDGIASPLEKAIQKQSISQKLKDTGAGAPLKKGGIRDLIQQAGYQTSTKKFWIYSVLTGFIVFLLCWMRGMHPFVAILFMITGILGLPKLYLKFKAKRRQKQFLEEFPDALDAMVRLLKAGMPVSEAIAMAGREFPGPVGVEMAYVYDQQRIGTSLAAAAEQAAVHVPITEMQMFATALAIQTETGASLSEVLTNLSGVIRARFKLKRKVVALSSEARTSAMIIGALPIMVATLLNLINPEYMDPLFTDTTGKVLLWCSGIWMSLGVLVMRQMINFRV